MGQVLKSGAATAPVIVKKYANRRLYDTEGSTYITLDDLANMVRAGRDLVVYDARTGDDITRLVLTQIIMEEETRGRSILPTSFLRQLIGFYGDEMQGIVPEYLEEMMRKFTASDVEPASASSAPIPSSGLAPVSIGPVPIASAPVPPVVPSARHEVVETARHDVDTILERASRVFTPVLAVREAERRQPSREDLQAEVALLRRELAIARDDEVSDG